MTHPFYTDWSQQIFMGHTTARVQQTHWSIASRSDHRKEIHWSIASRSDHGKETHWSIVSAGSWKLKTGTWKLWIDHIEVFLKEECTKFWSLWSRLAASPKQVNTTPLILFSAYEMLLPWGQVLQIITWILERDWLTNSPLKQKTDISKETLEWRNVTS